MIKAIYNKSRAYTILSGEKLRAFPLRSGTRQGFPLLPTLIQEGFGSPSHSNREEEMKGIHVGKDEIKLSLFADNVTLYIYYQKTTKVHQ